MLIAFLLIRRIAMFSLMEIILPFFQDHRDLINGKIFRLRMMNDDRRCGLLRLKLKLFRHRYIDASGIQELKQLRLVLKTRTRGIAKAKSRTLIHLSKQLVNFRRIVASDAQFFTNSLVPQFSQRFCALNAQTMKVEVVSIIIGLEKFLSILAGSSPDSDEMKGYDINAAGITRGKVVRKA